MLLSILSCKTKKEDKLKGMTPQLEEKTPLEKGEVHILTQTMEFITSDTLRSGWNTLIYENKSPETHFILMDLYPEGKTINNTKKEILPPFDEGMNLIMEGDIENAIAAFGKLPPWFQEVKYMGGTGFISPLHTAKSIVYLEPGLYIMECYVKMANGTWHTSHGMLKEIIVLDEPTALSPPNTSVKIDISSTEGIVLKDSLTAGKQVFETTFLDQKVYEHFLGHDINLVKYETKAALDSLVSWVNWMETNGLRTPTPKGLTFLGGMNNLPEGGKGYFEVDLSPGNYVLISEVPEANKKKLMHTFSIK